MLVKAEPSQRDTKSAKIIFRFEVILLSGPVTSSFVAKHPEAPSRIIEIRGSQTLDALHQAIFRSFDREDHHMYEFQFGGKEPMDRKAKRYGIAIDAIDPKAQSAETASIASLNLQEGSSFFYWFDFGDDWWHEVRLLGVTPAEKNRKRYPCIVEKKGASPPQYVDWDEEDEEEEA